MFITFTEGHVDITTKIEQCHFRGATAFSNAVHRALLLESFERIMAHRDQFQVELHEVSQIQRKVSHFEGEHRAGLEKLAVELVRECFKVTENELNYDSRLVDPGSIQPIASVAGKDEISSDRRRRLGADLELEIQKRRVINALVQGGAHSVQDIYLLADKAWLPKEMVTTYRQLMSFYDSLYWLNPIFNQVKMTKEPEAYSGVNRLDFSTQPMTVRAEGVVLPLLVHELAKGTLECLALHGLPEEVRERRIVIDYADGAENEQWDFRMGIALWQRFLKVATDANTRSALFRNFVSLPAPIFFDALAELTGDNLGEQQVKSIFATLKASF